MAEIYTIQDQDHSYGEIETNCPIGLLKLAVINHIETIKEYNLKELVKNLNKVGYKAAERDVIYIDVDNCFTEYDINRESFGEWLHVKHD